MSPYGAEGGGGVSANEYSCAHGAQINFGNLTPYLTYGVTTCLTLNWLTAIPSYIHVPTQPSVSKRLRSTGIDSEESISPEPVFVNVYVAQDSIPRN